MILIHIPTRLAAGAGSNPAETIGVFDMILKMSLIHCFVISYQIINVVVFREIITHIELSDTVQQSVVIGTYP